MTIKGLLNKLKLPSCNIRLFKGQIVGIDAQGWLYKGASKCTMDLLLNRRTTTYVTYVINRVQELIDCGIKPILVFDGASLKAKDQINAARRRHRNKHKNLALEYYRHRDFQRAESHSREALRVTSAMVEQTIAAVKKLGVDCLVAPYEADAQLAFLESIGHISAIITEDSDLIAFGCNTIIYKLRPSGICLLYQRGRVESTFKHGGIKTFTKEMLLHMCILAGCDYLPNIPGIGIQRAHLFMQRNGDIWGAIDDIIDNDWPVPNGYFRRAEKAEMSFLYQRVFDPRSKTVVHMKKLPRGVNPRDYAVGPHIEPEHAQKICLGGSFSLVKVDIKNVEVNASDLQREKGRQEISEIVFEKMKEGQVGRTAYTVKNNSTRSRRFKVFILPGGFSGYKVEVPLKGKYVSLNPGKTYKGIVSITAPLNTYGEFRCVIIFHFGGFVIGRFASTLVVDAEGVIDGMRPKTPYKKRPTPKRPKGKVVRAPFSRADFAKQFKHKLPPYPIPKPLDAILSCKSADDVHRRLQEGPWLEGYVPKMQTLLWIEEVQACTDIRHYDMEGVRLQGGGNGGYLRLRVPGLAEKRPSLLYGDSVFVTLGGDDRQWEGRVHQVELSSVMLKFARRFHELYVNGMPCNVRFTFSRTPLKKMHNAVSLFENEPPAWEVKNNYPNDLVLKYRIAFYNPRIGQNPSQQRAIIGVLSHNSKLPYVIFGPPGTGKTVTVVEAVKQMYNKKQTVLVVAPSNSAADLLVERLGHGGPIPRTQLFRLNAYSRNPREVSDIVKKHSIIGDNDRFAMPTLAQLKTKRVVVSTVVSAGYVYSLGIEKGFYDCVVVDEAGQATEPELLIAASCAGPKTKLVLAGDPKQLGPIIRSKIAVSYDLHVSLLERLHNIEPYKYVDNGDVGTYCNGYNKNFITKLTYNYRSHPTLLKVPSALFYNNLLEPKADPLRTTCLMNFEKLPNNKIPFIFHGCVHGKDEREGNSPSWFNAFEAKLVFQYIQALSFMRKNRPRMEEIGVIAPYNKQAKKIRDVLYASGYEGVTVGPVEIFQGREYKVIIISTVRSSHKHIDFDYKYNLGFLKNPKRFNVAITRAQALLIVIGNPLVLSCDENWSHLIAYALANKCYTGDSFDPKKELPGNRILDALQVEQNDDDDEDVEAFEPNLEAPFNRNE